MFKKITIFGISSLLSCQLIFVPGAFAKSENEKDASWLTVQKETADIKQDSQTAENDQKDKNSFPYNIIFNINQKDSEKVLEEKTSSKPALLKEKNRPQDEEGKLTSSFSYFEIGMGPMPIFLPAFSFGVRNQTNNHGFDVSLKLATVIAITQVNADVLYHYYSKPNLESQFYVGAGLGGSGFFRSHHKSYFAFGPEFVLGRQFQTKTKDTRFVQLKVNWPTIAPDSHHDKAIYFPFTTLSYGFCF